MAKFDDSPDELGPYWQDDNIYCEATCRKEDLYYEGSEDEDYEAPEIRRQRYERAGQRFLNGNVPLLLSARLQGPFDKDSGWTNPWRSKFRTARQMRPQSKHSVAAASQKQSSRHESILQNEHTEIPDSMDCHLPSPESLKQVAVAEPHPFLKVDELAKVQQWRRSVPGPQLSKDSFWTSKSPLPSSVKKKRARGSEWLKKLATKRRKTDDMDSEAVNTPPRQRGKDHARGYTPVHANISFGSAPGRIDSSANPSKRRRSHSSMREDESSNEQDELTISVNPSFTSAPGRLNSPPKRISPKRIIRKDSQAAMSEDELNQQKIASAKLSSPISQRSGKPPVTRRPSVVQEVASRSNLAKGSPSPERPAKRILEVTGAPGVAVADGVPGNDSKVPAFTLETQQDQSFCFKMRHNVGNGNGHTQVPLPDTQVEPTHDSVHFQSVESDAKYLPGSEDDHLRHEEQQSDALSSVASCPADDYHNAVQSSEKPEVRDEKAYCANGSRPEVEADEIAKQLGQSLENTDPQQGSRETNPGNESGVGVEADDVGNAPSKFTEQETKRNGAQSADNDAVLDIGSLSRATENPAKSPSEDQLTSENISMRDCVTADQSHAEKISAGLDDVQTAVQLPTLRDGTPASDGGDAVVARNAPEPSIEAERKGSSDAFLKNILHRVVSASPWAKLSQLSSRTSASPVPETTAVSERMEQMDETTAIVANGETTPSRTPGVATDGDAVQSPQNEVLDAVISDANITSSVVFSNSSPAVTPVPPPMDTHDHVAQDVTKVTGATETPSRTTFSQQSPWIKSQLSQQCALTSGEPALTDDALPVTPVPQPNDKRGEMDPAAQTPWAGSAEIFSTADEESASPAMNDTTIAGTTPIPEEGNKSLPPVPPFPARLSTPEPQFAVKSFASFISPSPKQTRQKRASHQGPTSGLFESHGALASAMKATPGSESNKRVSWAPLPDEQESTSGPQDSHAAAESSVPSRDRARQASPPPVASLADLPTSENAKFMKHFTAVASRTGGLRQRILPPASQQTQRSPGPFAMAEKFLSVDQVGNAEMEKVDDEKMQGVEASQQETVASQEPMDIVEDVFREMGDFWQTWDVDAELTQARKADELLQAADQDVDSQGGW